MPLSKCELVNASAPTIGRLLIRAAETAHAAHTRHHFLALFAAKLLHQLLHLLELVAKTVDVFHLHAAACRDAALAGSLQKLRLCAFFGRHGKDDRRVAVHNAVVNVHFIELRTVDAGQFREDAL